jgi:hypothetical protein
VVRAGDFAYATENERLMITSGIEIPVLGYVDAVRRFADASARLPADQAQPVHVALFEALNWLHSPVVGADGAIGVAPAKTLLGDPYVKSLTFVRGRAIIVGLTRSTRMTPESGSGKGWRCSRLAGEPDYPARTHSPSWA